MSNGKPAAESQRARAKILFDAIDTSIETGNLMPFKTAMLQKPDLSIVYSEVDGSNQELNHTPLHAAFHHYEEYNGKIEAALSNHIKPSTENIAKLAMSRQMLHDMLDVLEAEARSENEHVRMHAAHIINAHAYNTGITPLQLATHFGDTQLIERMLQSGGNPFSQNFLGDSAMHLITDAKTLDTIIRHYKITDTEQDFIGGMRLDHQHKNCKIPTARLSRESSLQTLASQGLVLRLLEQVSKEDRQALAGMALDNNRDITLLNYFCEQNDKEALLRVLKMGVSPNTQTPINKMSPLHILAQEGQDDGQFAEIFLQHGANIHIKNVNEETPLHTAVANGKENLTTFLLDQGACKTERNKFGENIMCAAIQSGKLRMVERLYKRGVEFGAPTTDGKLEIHHAAKGRFSHLIHWLRDKGQDIDAQDKQGITPLMEVAALETNKNDRASEYKRVFIRKMLNDTYADPTIRNKDGKLARHLLQNEDFYAARMLAYAEESWVPHPKEPKTKPLLIPALEEAYEWLKESLPKFPVQAAEEIIKPMINNKTSAISRTPTSNAI